MSKAQDLAKQLFENVKSHVAERIDAIGPEIGAELKRLGTQGQMELASALFSERSSFVPYGPGQYTPSPEHQHGQQQSQEHGMDVHGRERGGIER